MLAFKKPLRCSRHKLQLLRTLKRTIVGNKRSDRARTVVLEPAKGRIDAGDRDTPQPNGAFSNEETVIVARRHVNGLGKSCIGSWSWLLVPRGKSALSSLARLVDNDLECSQARICERGGCELVLLGRVEAQLTYLVIVQNVEVKDRS